MVFDLQQAQLKIIRSKRKTIALEITREAAIIVRAHPRVPLTFIESFIIKKQAWIQRKQKEIIARNKQTVIIDPCLIEQYKEETRKKIRESLDRYTGLMGVSYKRFRISRARSRFGSCTSKGTLSFSWRLNFYPQAVIDYVVVHELTHLQEFNHSPRFWALVARVMPEYQQQRRWLRKNGHLVALP